MALTNNGNKLFGIDTGASGLSAPAIDKRITKYARELGMVDIRESSPNSAGAWEDAVDELVAQYPGIQILFPYEEDINGLMLYGLYGFTRSVIAPIGSVPVGVGKGIDYNNNTSTVSYRRWTTTLVPLLGNLFGDNHPTRNDNLFDPDTNPNGIGFLNPFRNNNQYHPTSNPEGVRAVVDANTPKAFPEDMRLSNHGYLWISGVDLATNWTDPVLANGRENAFGNFNVNGKPCGNSGIRGVMSGGGRAEKIQGIFTTTLVASTENYVDNIAGSGIGAKIKSQLQHEPNIRLATFAGDSRELDNIGSSIPPRYGDVYTFEEALAGVSIYNKFSMSVVQRNSINGGLKDKGSFGYVIGNLYEHQNNEQDGGGLRYRFNANHLSKANPTAYVFKNSGYVNRASCFNDISDCSIIQRINFNQGWADEIKPAINIEDRGQYITWRRLFNIETLSGGLSKTTVKATFVSWEGIVDPWHFNYCSGMADGAKHVDGVLVKNASFPDVSNMSTCRVFRCLPRTLTQGSEVLYNGTTGQVAYNMFALQDPVRMCGAVQQAVTATVPRADFNTEQLIDVVDGSATIVELLLTRHQGLHDYNIMLCARDSSVPDVLGEYNKFAQIPVHVCDFLYDKGDIVGGIPWQPYVDGSGNAKSRPAINTGWDAGIVIKDGIAHIKGKSSDITGPPIVGTFTAGDYCEVIGDFTDSEDRKIRGWKRSTTGSSHAVAAQGVASPDWIPDVVEVYPYNFYLGGAEYNDTQHDTTPFVPTVGVWSTLPNNAGVTWKEQMPIDLTDLYDVATQKILGRNGDFFALLVECDVTPTTGASTVIDFAIDIGGSIGRIYPETFNFPKGQGVSNKIIFKIPNGYMRDTFEANGGLIVVNPSAAVEIRQIRYVTQATYRAR